MFKTLLKEKKMDKVNRLRHLNDFRSVHVGGKLNNGGKAGLSSRNSNNDLSNSNSNIGSQLSYSHLIQEVKPYLLVEQKNNKNGISSNMQESSNKIAKLPKKLGNIYPLFYSEDNIRLAFKNAMKGKTHYKQVKKIQENIKYYIDDLHKMLKNRQFVNGKYKVFKKESGNKIREIYKLPFYPDRVVHHCILQVLEEFWKRSLITDTYSTIPGRGPHLCAKKLKKVLSKPKYNYKYCLKLDIKKYYPSIDHNVLKKIIRKKIKDKYTLELLDKIIDSEKGIPIGNYISQWFGNLYLNPLDHYAKEKLRIKQYYRYCDDIVILAKDKKTLWTWFEKIKKFANTRLKLKIKNNYQVFPISKRGIDFLGYRFFQGYTLVRKRIIKAFKQKLKHPKSKASYFGWIIHADSYRFRQKYFMEEYAKCQT